MVSNSVLIVEDENIIALDLKLRLEKSGYTVVDLVSNLPDALTAVEKLSPDIILMDIRIRGDRDGIYAAECIRHQFDIPVIFVSAHSDSATRERADVAGGFDFIAKPLRNVDFRERIESALLNHARQRKVRSEWALLRNRR